MGTGAIFSGDGVKLLKPKLKFKDSDASIETSINNNVTVNDVDGANLIRRPSKQRFIEDFKENLGAAVTTTTGLAGSVNSFTGGAFDGGFREMGYVILGTDLGGTIDFDSISVNGLIDRNLLGLHLRYSYNGDAEDWSRVIQESSDDVVFTDIGVEGFLNGKVNETFIDKRIFKLKSTSTHYRLRLKCEVENTGRDLRIQQYEVITDPMPTAEFVQIESVELVGHAGYGAGTFIPYFTTELDNTISNLGTLTNDSVDGLSFTAKGSVTLSISHSLRSDAASRTVGISKNSNQLSTSIASITDIHRKAMESTASNTNPEISLTIHLKNGETVRPHYSAAFVPTSIGQSTLTITATASQSNVVWEGATSEFDSMLRYSGAVTRSGNVLTFLNKEEEIGSAIVTVNNSEFTPTENGIYTINTTIIIPALGNVVVIGKNHTGTDSTNPLVLDWGHTEENGGYSATANWTGYLTTSDVITINTSSATDASTNQKLTISKAAITPNYAVPASNIEPTVTKVLSANTSTIAEINELATDMTIGKEYNLKFFHAMQWTATGASTGIVEFRESDGTTIITRSQLGGDHNNGNAFRGNTIDLIFTAQSNKLRVYLINSQQTLLIGNGTKIGTHIQLTERNRDGYPLVEVSKVVHSNAETWTGERWIDGRKIWMRSYNVTGSFTGTVNIDNTFPVGAEIIDMDGAATNGLVWYKPWSGTYVLGFTTVTNNFYFSVQAGTFLEFNTTIKYLKP